MAAVRTGLVRADFRSAPDAIALGERIEDYTAEVSAPRLGSTSSLTIEP
ncbi:hypothetical protein AB0465_04415 [Streptomyces griseoviridis]